MKKNIYRYIFSILFCCVVIAGCKSRANNSPSKKGQDSLVQDTGHGKTIWGSSSGAFPNEKGVSRIEAWKRLNEKIKELNGGHGLQARRSYDSDIPVSFSASAMGPDVGLCSVSIGSFKPSLKETLDGSNHIAIKRFIQSVPDNQIVYLVFHHEPEDEVLSSKNGFTPELFQEAFAKFVDVVLSAGKPNVHPCFVLMSWTFNPKSHRNPEAFNMAAKLKPEQLNKVIAGLDGYAAEPAEASAKNTFEANFAKMASWGFTRFGIFETATHSADTSPGRSEWIDEFGAWVNARKDIELVSWFNSGVGPHAGKEGWFLGKWSVNQDGSYDWTDSDGSLAAYSRLLKNK